MLILASKKESNNSEWFPAVVTIYDFFQIANDSLWFRANHVENDEQGHAFTEWWNETNDCKIRFYRFID